MKKLVAALILVMLIAVGGFWSLFTGFSIEDAKEMAKKVMDRKAAISDLEKKAGAGNLKSQVEIAKRYASGEGGAPKDYKKALTWFYKAAKQGDPTAQLEIGKMYEKGQGIGQDNFRAAEWFRVAAGPGKNADAQFALGQMYATGRGVPNDYNKAVHFYGLAANQGHAAAQFLLGAMHSEGWGVKKNYVESYKWFALAMDNEDAALAVSSKYDATGRRNALAAKMNRAQISEAEKAAEAWRQARKSAGAKGNASSKR